MVRYDYFCPECDSTKEVSHGMFEEPDIICDKCGAKMKKAFTNLSFELKGYGWAGKSTATQGKAKRVTETKVGVPAEMVCAVSDDLKKSAARIEKGA